MSTLTKPVGAPASQDHPNDVAGAPVQHVQQIPIGLLMPSPDNPRKTIDPLFLAQLADSIQQLGIQVPLLVRPWGTIDDGKGSDAYEIIAGHRRFAAAEKLVLETLPCIVREMDDDEAREIMLVENLQREDLPPLEEAQAYDALRATLGTAEAIAAKVGKPVEYVTRRLKLLTLIPFSRTALAEKLITIDHALLLAKLAAAEQEQALRFTLHRLATRKDKTQDIVAISVKRRTEKRAYGYWEPQSVLELKRFIEDEIKLELKRAPWDLADAELLPSAGACAGCAKNTAANTALFGDLAVTDARCTDAACFAAKRDAFVQIQLEAVNRVQPAGMYLPVQNRRRAMDCAAAEAAEDELGGSACADPGTGETETQAVSRGRQGAAERACGMSAIAGLLVFAGVMELVCGHFAGAGVLFMGAGLLAAMVVRRAFR